MARLTSTPNSPRKPKLKPPEESDSQAVNAGTPTRTPSSFISRLAARILPASTAAMFSPSRIIPASPPVFGNSPAPAPAPAVPDNLNLQAIIGHRSKPDGEWDMRCKWPTGPPTLVPEDLVKDIDPMALRTYWGQVKDPLLRQRADDLFPEGTPYITAHRLVWETESEMYFAYEKEWSVEMWIKTGELPEKEENGTDDDDVASNQESCAGDWIAEIEAQKLYNSAVLTYLHSLPETRSKRNLTHPESRLLTSMRGKHAQKVPVLHRIVKVLRYMPDSDFSRVQVQYCGYSEREEDTEVWPSAKVREISPQAMIEFMVRLGMLEP